MRISLKEHITRRLAETYMPYAEHQAHLLPGYSADMEEDDLAGLVYQYYYLNYSQWTLPELFSVFINLVHQGEIPVKELEYISELPVSLIRN